MVYIQSYTFKASSDINEINYFFSLLFVVALVCMNLCTTEAVEITCDFNVDDECVFNDNVNLDGDVEIGNSDSVKQDTTNILVKAPLQTNVIPKAIFDAFPSLKSLMITPSRTQNDF